MSSAYPPAPAPSQYFTKKGVSGVVWGTTGMWSSYIVVSATDGLRVEEIDIEQGTGFEAVVILLNKGVDITFEVIDDANVVPPVPGAVATWSTPFGSVAMLVVNSNANQARKREGMRSITAKSFNAIDLGLNTYTA